MTQELFNDNPDDYPKYLAADWQVYIGNSENPYENPRCGDSESSTSYEDVYSDRMGKEIPAFGFSKECNMLGTFTHFVANYVPTVSVTLCNTIVIGTKYIRDEPLPAGIEVQAGSLAVFSVPHVFAQDTIGNVLAIDLRLSADSEYTAVELSNGAGATEVTIDATSVYSGEYTLKLESFD